MNNFEQSSNLESLFISIHARYPLVKIIFTSLVNLFHNSTMDYLGILSECNLNATPLVYQAGFIYGYITFSEGKPTI